MNRGDVGGCRQAPASGAVRCERWEAFFGGRERALEKVRVMLRHWQTTWKISQPASEEINIMTMKTLLLSASSSLSRCLLSSSKSSAAGREYYLLGYSAAALLQCYYVTIFYFQLQCKMQGCDTCKISRRRGRHLPFLADWWSKYWHSVESWIHQKIS